MKGLIWNCRGIKKKGVCSFLNSLILEHKFHFIGLQETMQQNIEDCLLRKIDPSQNYLWQWTPSTGKSGGILVGINMEFLDVGSFTEGEYMLQLNLWDKKLRVKWNLIVVYGAAQEEGKDSFLAELALFCGRNKEPYIVGDFNIIRFSHEKNKDGRLRRHSNTFNSIIHAYELREISMNGGKYT